MCEYNSNIIDRLIPPPPTNFDVGHNGSLGGLCSMTRGAVAPLVCMLKKALDRGVLQAQREERAGKVGHRDQLKLIICANNAYLK